MKMVKNVLMGLAAIALVVSLTGCPKDDTEGAIKGAGKKWSVDYTNDATENYRAYKATGANHAGGLVKVEFNKGATPGESKMGVIFGLESYKDENKKSLRKFQIIGLSETGNYYVSSYDKVADIQAKNFGTDDGATEKEWVALGAKTVKMSEDTNGNKYTYVWYQAQIDGSYKWAIASMTDDQAAAWDKTTGALPAGATELAKGTIDKAFDAVADESKLPQHAISVYAMIQPGKNLSGKWNIIGAYKEAEDAE